MHIVERASPTQSSNRQILEELFKESPLPTNELLVNLHMYLRSSVVAKILYVNELYELIVRVPGVIMEFGVWWGANLALMESLRAVYEPYNYARKTIGFDTFSGYNSPSGEDGSYEGVAEGSYAVASDYRLYLEKLLQYHEDENTMAHIKKVDLVEGDAPVMLEEYLDHNPQTVIALAYFDMQLYEPTKRCLELIRPRLTRGSVIAMDELNCAEFPGETVAYADVIGLDRFRLQRSRYLPDRTYAIVD